MFQSSGRSLLIGISAWISFCLLIAGWLPNPGPEIHSLWMLSGLVGLVSCVGLAEVMKSDVKQQQELIDQYIEAAMTDGLTRLANRQALDKALNDIFSSQHEQGPMCLIMLDIDHFKQINDEHGHLGGDTVLKCLSTQAMQFFRGKGSVARYGGEEFAVALPNTKLKQAFAIAEEFRKLVKSSSCEFLDETLSITISAGVAEIKDQDTPESLIRRADLALYTAKKLGRDCIWLADSATGLMDSEECLTFG